MPEINYQSIKQHINECINLCFNSVYLIFGEEFLCRQVTQDLINAIIPDVFRQKHNYEVVNYREEGQLADVIERMNTYSFFSEKKIVELRDATVFVARHNQGNALQKIRQLYENNDFEKAGNRFLNLLSRLQIDLSDIPAEMTDDALADKFNLGEDQSNDIDWIKKLCAYCQERKLPVPAAGDDAERLKIAIEAGFPKKNLLIITTDTVDKRKALYKTIKNTGTIIDCSIAKGARKVDIDAQRAVLRQHMQNLLQKHNKQIPGPAFELIFQFTGFDLRAFAASIDKLVDYAGDRDRISIEDVRAVLIRTRKDPVYELTGALAERNTLKTLNLMTSLLADGFHHLQIMAALTNQIRKLLVIKDFQESKAGRNWHPGMVYDQFRQTIIPLIVKYDENLLEKVSVYQAAAKGRFDESIDSKKKKKPDSDLVIAKYPNNPYPVFLQFRNCSKYGKNELLAAFDVLSHADVKLKTTGQNPVTVLEEVVFKICT